MERIKFDVVTVGAGVIGLSIAKALAKNGLKVAVIDRDEKERHASYKAGGMLGAQNEFSNDTPLFQLAQISRTHFKPLRDELLEDTGIDIQYSGTGLIKMADSGEDSGILRKQFRFLNSHNEKVKRLSNDDVRNMSNDFIAPNDHFAMHIPGDGQVNANKYTRALTESAVNNGVTRISHTEVRSIHHTGQSYRLSTSRGDIAAAKVIITAGAWSHELLEPFGIRSYITGVKGEVMLLGHPDVQLEDTLFMTNGCYIIPKRMNRFLIGATSLFNDFSTGFTENGGQWLWAETLKRIPMLEDAEVLMKSSGIRPYTPDETPVMDEVRDGLFVVGGHYRNGILLSPITGELMSGWIMTNRRPRILEEFTIERMKTHAMHHQ